MISCSLDISLAGEVAQSTGASESQPQPGLAAHLYPANLQLADFVREGWRRMKGEGELEKGLEHEIIESDNFYLTPAFQPGKAFLLKR